MPKNPLEGERLLVFEPPHLTSGLVARDSLLGEQFFFNESEFPGYLKSFTKATDALRDARYLLPAGHDRLIREVQLRPPNTYTLNYRDGLLLP